MEGEQLYIIRVFVFDEEFLCPFCDLIRDWTKIKIKLAFFYNNFRSSVENFSNTTVHHELQ